MGREEDDGRGGGRRRDRYDEGGQEVDGEVRRRGTVQAGERYDEETRRRNAIQRGGEVRYNNEDDVRRGVFYDGSFLVIAARHEDGLRQLAPAMPITNNNRRTTRTRCDARAGYGDRDINVNNEALV